MKRQYQSWGHYPPVRQEALALVSRDNPLPLPADEAKRVLPYGNGRSYGDSCLNDAGTLLDARGLDRFIAFDPATGVLRCEAGVLLAEILDLVVPQGWFIPATPGTKLITVGGAIANDVHGKGHHRDGTFGRHVRQFELLRSDGSRLLCSPEQNPGWFAATIGGLGLTGLITWAEVALKRVANPFIDGETIRCDGLDDFFAVSSASDQDYEYTVAWLDCSARGRSLGRGHFMRGNHAPPLAGRKVRTPTGSLTFPFQSPVSLVNGLTLRAFNFAYYHRQLKRETRALVHYDPFFYPLDAIHEWNRLYGPRGFFQYQCVIPREAGREPVREVLARIAAAGTGSFLAVMKVFGSVESPGILSFPRQGVTLAVDFPNRGKPTLALMEQLDRVVRDAGGRGYPAKDARMSPESFRQYYPQWEQLKPFIDPRFSSSFWRRVTGEHS